MEDEPKKNRGFSANDCRVKEIWSLPHRNSQHQIMDLRPGPHPNAPRPFHLTLT